jgi:hypothetical protein
VHKQEAEGFTPEACHLGSGHMDSAQEDEKNTVDENTQAALVAKTSSSLLGHS